MSDVPNGMLELSIEKLVPGGDGLAFHEGMAVFVPGVVPGEKVLARITETRKDYRRAVLVEVIVPSPERQEPPCALAGMCGGCDWLHIRYEEQLELKKGIVRETLRRVGGMVFEGLEIEPSPPLGYRTRAQIHRDGEGKLGFMGARSRSVVAVDTCPVASPPISRAFREPPPTELARYTVIANGDRLISEGRDDGEDIAVSVRGKRILFSVRCFFQGNLAALEKLIPFAISGLRDTSGCGEGGGASGARGKAADLYCGVGVFGAHMAGLFEGIIAVESDPLSLSYARRNIPAGSNEFHPLSVERWIDTQAPESPLAAAVMDPPRAGLSRPVREYLRERGPRRLVYVSCNPVTLARDLASLVSGGYGLRDLRLFDFFPQTSHVESVAMLERSGT